MKTKIQASIVIGYRNKDHVIFENGEVVFEEDRILFVGHDYPYPVDRVIDAGNAIVCPGFIDLNALGDIDHDILHFEAAESLSKGLIWSHEYAQNNPENIFTLDEAVFNNRYAFAQLIRNGITTAMPITSVLNNAWTREYEEMECAVHVAAQLGLRVYLGPSYQSGVRTASPQGEWNIFWQPEKGETGLQDAVNFIRNFDGAYDGLIKGFLAPERIETITPELLIESKRYSDELGCPIRLHAAQGSFEYREIVREHNLTPIAYLESIGFLGPRTLIPHAIFVSGSKYVQQAGDQDLEFLARSGASIIHCPLIMARHGLTLDSYARYQQVGVNITMGTDTFPPDMIENIRFASILAKVVKDDSRTGTAADFFRAATLSAAKALGREDLGRLEPGAKADIIIVDLSQFHTGQIDDPIKTMIFGASGVNVITSIINGRIVMWEGQIPGEDDYRLHARAQACFEKIKHGYSIRDYLHRSEAEMFPSSFRVVEREEGGGKVV
jgi:cytosine/adenosine deaminase-related metal-dependent hydrolase